MQPQSDDARRDLMRQAACVAGAWALSGALPVVAAGEVQRHPRSRLVDARGTPFKASQLKNNEAFLFNYPYTVSPVFLIAFEREVDDRYALVVINAHPRDDRATAFEATTMQIARPGASLVDVLSGESFTAGGDGSLRVEVDGYQARILVPSDQVIADL